ncbi:MAG: hypothetical protein ABI891_16375 [Acidobacteriota bacterium]
MNIRTRKSFAASFNSVIACPIFSKSSCAPVAIPYAIHAFPNG